MLDMWSCRENCIYCVVETDCFGCLMFVTVLDGQVPEAMCCKRNNLCTLVLITSMPLLAPTFGDLICAASCYNAG